MVASTGAGQPNYWPKTWFGANAYSAKFGVPNYTIKSVRTFIAVVRGAIKPLANIKRTKVYGCYLIGLPTGEKERKRKKKKKENRKGAKVISWGSKAPVVNCFHCNLINTSRRIDTSSAISNRLFNMLKNQGRAACGSWKTGRVIVNETTLKILRASAFLAVLVWLSFKRAGDQAIR